MPSKKSAALARRQAHEALAAHRQQRLERERANEADLTTYLLLAQQVRDIETAHRDALAALHRRQAHHLRQWHARGEKLSDIAELTGNTTTELRRFLETASPTDPVVRADSKTAASNQVTARSGVPNPAHAGSAP